jgi:hypothetical protein
MNEINTQLKLPHFQPYIKPLLDVASTNQDRINRNIRMRFGQRNQSELSPSSPHRDSDIL